jgi:hypothetical protein
MTKMEKEKVKGKEEKKGPERKVRVGRFSICLWRRERIIPAGDYSPEKRFDVVRASIQYSRKDRQTGEFVNMTIFCSPHELRELVNCLDELNNVEGGDSPSAEAGGEGEVPQ